MPPNARSIGEIFPLQGTLCQKLQEELTRFCSGAADREAARPPLLPLPTAAAAAATSIARRLSERNDSDGSTNNHGGSRGDGGDAATAATATVAEAMEVDTDGARRPAGGGARERDSSAVRFAIETIRESTGVSAELASYALLISKVCHHWRSSVLSFWFELALRCVLTRSR